MPVSSSLAVFKGSTRLITVLLKTLIFISNPYGIAFLAYLLAGLADFFFFLAGPILAHYLFTLLRDFLQSLGESKLLSLFISQHN